MIEYRYCKRDLLKHPEKYQMSPYDGIEFLHAYSMTRCNALKKLNTDSNKNVKEFVNTKFTISKTMNKFISTYEFLCLTLTDIINDNSSEWNEILDIFLKKFEVKKKIFTAYDKQYKEITEDYLDLKNYILLSANFILTYQQTSNLKYLNACLKLNDLVISNLDKIYDLHFKQLFFIILRMELDLINNLCMKEGITST